MTFERLEAVTILNVCDRILTTSHMKFHNFQALISQQTVHVDEKMK